MIDGKDVRDLLRTNIQGTAAWRLRKAQEEDGDPRHCDAARRLAMLSNALDREPCAPLLERIAQICAQCDSRELLRLSELEWDLLREIGFSNALSTADAYLSTLIGRFARVGPEFFASMYANAPAFPAKSNPMQQEKHVGGDSLNSEGSALELST